MQGFSVTCYLQGRLWWMQYKE